MDQFVMGLTAMGSWVAGLFFLRFWKESRDRLFLIFAMAFWFLGLSRLAVALTPDASENHIYLYWLRFLAFALILVAIIDKNRPAKAR